MMKRILVLAVFAVLVAVPTVSAGHVKPAASAQKVCTISTNEYGVAVDATGLPEYKYIVFSVLNPDGSLHDSWNLGFLAGTGGSFGVILPAGDVGAYTYVFGGLRNEVYSTCSG